MNATLDRKLFLSLYKNNYHGDHTIIIIISVKTVNGNLSLKQSRALQGTFIFFNDHQHKCLFVAIEVILPLSINIPLHALEAKGDSPHIFFPKAIVSVKPGL